ncbi:hypothetical protein [Nonomuraea sp. NPDC001023]|uniref:hypothetical protein n=1 Tax=unclassified Nonomuraea TaxID=2593643 RepID=UPI003317AAE6
MGSRKPQDYSPDEFDSVVAMIRKDASLRADIEAITGQTLNGKTPRELFNLFRTIQQTTAVQAAVVNYGRARQAVRDTRAMLAEGALEDLDAADPALRRIRDLEAKVDELKSTNIRLKETNKALMSGKPINVIKGEVAS